MNESSFKYLKFCVDRLSEQMRSIKRKRNGSNFLALLDVKSNVRFKLINAGSVLESAIPNEERKYLKEQGYIRQGDQESNQIVVTGKGLWKVEKESGTINETELIEGIDEKWYRFQETSKPVSEKEKVILCAMIAGRSFSRSSSVDLKLGKMALSAWNEVVSLSFDALKKWGAIIKLKKEDLFGKPGNELPVSNLIRHTDALPKKTRDIYSSSGEQKYYLALTNESGALDESKLSYVMELALAGIEMSSHFHTIKDFFSHIAHTKGYLLFANIENYNFNSSECDEIVERSLLKLLR